MKPRTSLCSVGILSFFDGLILPLLLLTVFTKLGFFNTSSAKFYFIILGLYALAMTFSNYLTQKSHNDLTIKNETFQNIGLSKTHEEQLLQEHVEEQKEWEKIIAEQSTASFYSIYDLAAIILGYFTAGIVLYIPFYLLQQETALITAYLIGFIMIIITGFYKAKITSNHPFRVIATSVLYTTILCSMAVFIIHLMN